MFKIFIFTLKNNLKAFWITLSIIVITLVMIAILGNAIENMQETGLFYKEIVGVYNNMEQPYNEEFENLLNQEEFEELLEIVYLDDADNLESLIEDGEFHTIVNANVIDGKNVVIVSTVYPESFVLTIASNFVGVSNTVTMVAEENGDIMATQDVYNTQVLKTEELEEGSPIGVDYYGVQTLFQIAVLLGILAVYSVLEDKTKNIMPRIKTAPISKIKIIAGRMFANVLYTTLILLLIAVSSHFIFDVNWSGNYFVILAVFVLFSIIITLLGMIAATLTKSVVASLGVIMGIGCTIWPRYSGAFSPYYDVGVMAYTSPNFHAKNIIFSAIYGGSTNVILEGLLYLCVLAVVMLAIYIIAERSKANERI